MQKPRRYYDAYYNETDDDNIIPDGGSVSVPLELMDGLQRGIYDARTHQPHRFNALDHRPHFAVTSEAETFRRNAGRAVMIDRAVNGWRGRDAVPEPYEPDEPPDPDDDVDDRTRVKKARDTYLKNLKNAWRTPTGFAGSVGPDNVGPQISNRVGAGDSGHRPMLSRDAAADLRNSAYAEYCSRISNAWRTR